MNWHVAIVNGLAHAAVGGTLFLAAGFLAVLLCRQPIRRIRLIELTLLGSLAVPVASQLPWLPHWSTGLLDLSTPVAKMQGAADSRAEPIAAMSAPIPMVPANTAPAATPLPERVAPQRLEAEAISPVEAEALSPAALIAVGYGAIAAGLLAWFALGVLSLARLYRSTYPVPGEVLELFRAIAGPAGDAVTLRASDRVELPLAFRGRRPIIVLPGSLCRSANDPALHYSLAHEWSHVEGGDVSRWYLTSLAQFLYFFNPLFWWLRRQLRLCQDYLADARAAEHARQTEDYAAYLVGLARRRLTVPVAALGIGDRRSNLYRRIIMLLQKRQSLERRCLKTWTAGTMVVGLAVLLACSSIRLDAGTPADDDKTPSPKETPQPTEKAETLHYTGRVFDKDTGKSIAGATVTVRRSLLGDPENKEQNPIMAETKHQTDAEGKYSFTIPPEQTSKRYLYIELDVEHPEYAPRSHFGYALSMIRKNEKI
ncbi:MAG TPA: M56 family metallopeptidase, partial [Gemmataceae bacterium]|nr:M56 family metallopeptidase [Gemmataceae bacterium]